MTHFQHLTLRGWRQFHDVSIDLSARVTVLTGANGTGKTSVLSVLSNHFGWNISFAATPYVSKRARKQLFRDIREEDDGSHELSPNVAVDVGQIAYSTGQVCSLQVPRFVGGNYNLSYNNQIGIIGLFIPSHRPQATYTSVSTIPTQPIEASQIYENYRNLLAQYYRGNQGNVKNPGLVQKEALISLAVFGEGNSSVSPNEGYRQAFTSFEERLRKILPKELGFRKIEIVMPDVVLVTDSGNFALDAMSGGVSSVFSTVWQIHMFDLGRDGYTIIMDEPENHLHPSMQRTLLPSLSAAFPNARFIVATHSPFIVSSLRDAKVYALMHNENNGVVSHRLTDKDLSGTANSVLREILGLETTIPIWAEEEIAAELDASQDLDPRVRAERLINRMRQIGISKSSDVKFIE